MPGGYAHQYNFFQCGLYYFTAMRKVVTPRVQDVSEYVAKKREHRSKYFKDGWLQLLQSMGLIITREMSEGDLIWFIDAKVVSIIFKCSVSYVFKTMQTVLHLHKIIPKEHPGICAKFTEFSMVYNRANSSATFLANTILQHLEQPQPQQEEVMPVVFDTQDDAPRENILILDDETEEERKNAQAYQELLETCDEHYFPTIVDH